jgi:hypothetical protein
MKTIRFTSPIGSAILIRCLLGAFALIFFAASSVTATSSATHGRISPSNQGDCSPGTPCPGLPISLGTDYTIAGLNGAPTLTPGGLQFGEDVSPFGSPFEAVGPVYGVFDLSSITSNTILTFYFNNPAPDFGVFGCDPSKIGNYTCTGSTQTIATGVDGINNTVIYTFTIDPNSSVIGPDTYAFAAPLNLNFDTSLPPTGANALNLGELPVSYSVTAAVATPESSVLPMLVIGLLFLAGHSLKKIFV